MDKTHLLHKHFSSYGDDVGTAQNNLQGQGRPVHHSVQWMPIPMVQIGCPPGLEYLTPLDQVLVHQQVELLEAFTGIETKNKYQVKNVLGQQIYFAFEESDVWMRMCCREKRSFTMHIVDNMNQEVLRVVRPFEPFAGCCWCADWWDFSAHTISVESPPGQVIGQLRQRSSKWRAHYDVLDGNSQPILKIRGPCCPCQAICCTEDVDFRIVSYDDSQQIGKISKQWAGVTKEWCTKADNYGMQFPVDLDVKVKATLLGALFLIEFMFFESQNNR